MTREELLRSKEYWIGEIQLDLYAMIEDYLKEYNLTRVQFAEQLGVGKSYVSQVLNGEFNHKISKLVELSLAIGKVPRVDFVNLQQIFSLDEFGELHNKRYENINIELKFNPDLGISTSNDLYEDSQNEISERKLNYSNYKNMIDYEKTDKRKKEVA